MFFEMTKRRYTQRLRAQKQGETRRRIVEAAAALHEEIGPRETTVSGIAARAGVQRLTVYRHFPDESSLLRACSSHWLDRNPPPDPALWDRTVEPAARSRAAFAALYAYYRRTASMWRSVYRDTDDMPPLRAVLAGFEDYLDGLRDDLVEAWAPDEQRRRVLSAAAGHAVRFSTWRSLHHQGLEDEEMGRAVTLWLAALARRRDGRVPAPTG